MYAYSHIRAETTRTVPNDLHSQRVPPPKDTHTQPLTVSQSDQPSPHTQMGSKPVQHSPYTRTQTCMHGMCVLSIEIHRSHTAQHTHGHTQIHHATHPVSHQPAAPKTLTQALSPPCYPPTVTTQAVYTLHPLSPDITHCTNSPPTDTRHVLFYKLYTHTLPIDTRHAPFCTFSWHCHKTYPSLHSLLPLSANMPHSAHSPPTFTRHAPLYMISSLPGGSG